MVSKTHSSGGLMVSDYPDDEELPTNHLQSDTLNARDISEEGSESSASGEELYEPATINWLAKLTASHAVQLEEDKAPVALTPPSGMSEHATASYMAPTRGARLSTGIRRGTTLILVLLLALGAAGSGIYALTSTSWLGDLLTSPPANSEVTKSSGSSQPPPAEQLRTEVEQNNSAGTSAIKLRDNGIAQYKAGKFEQAISTLESALALNSDDAITYYQLGLANLAVTDGEYTLADAELAFRTAASLQPDWAAPQVGLAESLMRRGYMSEAIAAAQEATRIEPALGEAWMTLGRALRGAGQEAEATRAFAEASRNAPAPPPVP